MRARAIRAPSSRALELLKRACMSAMAYHLTMRPTDDTWIARDTAERRRLARCLYACGEQRGLLAFRSVDTHLHAIVTGSRPEAGQFARIVESALRRRLPLLRPFEPARIRPIDTFKHLRSTLGYLFRQGQHHGLVSFDREHDASSLVDLLGMRLINSRATNARLFRALPRLSRPELLDLLDLPLDRETDPADYVSAGSAAVALPSLSGRQPSARAARAAVLRLVDGRIPLRQIADSIEVSRRTLERDRSTADPLFVATIAKMAKLRAALRQRNDDLPTEPTVPVLPPATDRAVSR
jgi:hypothetical protein